jgi:ADP-heptose:LPS heptosyltransferase
MSKWTDKLRKLFRNLRKNRQKLDLRLEGLRSRSLPRDEASVLVIRLDGIGDFVLWLECARAIRRRYPRPQYKITLAAASEYADLAELTGLFDKVIPVERQVYIWNNTYNRGILRQLADLRAAVAINPCISRDRHGDRLIYVSGAKERIGLDDRVSQTVKKQLQADRWYTHLVTVPSGLHEIEANAVFARYFDKEAALTRPHLTGLISVPEWVAPDQKYFVVFPGTASPKKKWPAERFAAVVERLQQQTNWTAIICGSNAERPSATAIIDLLGSHRIIDACGRTSLSDLAGLLQHAELLICNDTGAAHMAAAVDCPVVVPFGGWQFGRFLPYPEFSNDREQMIFPVVKQMPCFNCNWKCIYPREADGPLYCVNEVTIQSVWDAVSHILNRAHLDRPMTSPQSN